MTNLTDKSNIKSNKPIMNYEKASLMFWSDEQLVITEVQTHDPGYDQCSESSVIPLSCPCTPSNFMFKICNKVF